MPSAESFGKAFGLVRHAKIPSVARREGKDDKNDAYTIVKRSIGHTPIVPNRTYQYPITLTIVKAGASAKAKAETGAKIGKKRANPSTSTTAALTTEADVSAVASDKDKINTDGISAWFSGLCGDGGKRLVHTFYGNPYDIWIDPEFKVAQNCFGSLVLTAQGHGVRNFTVAKQPPTLLRRPGGPKDQTDQTDQKGQKVADKKKSKEK